MLDGNGRTSAPKKNIDLLYNLDLLYEETNDYSRDDIVPDVFHLIADVYKHLDDGRDKEELDAFRSNLSKACTNIEFLLAGLSGWADEKYAYFSDKEKWTDTLDDIDDLRTRRAAIRLRIEQLEQELVEVEQSMEDEYE